MSAGSQRTRRASFVVHAPRPLAPGSPLAGLVVDDWVEVVPNRTETTAVSFNYDAPGAVAPQAILLAVSPDNRPLWTSELLRDTVVEALDLAKIRAVDQDALGEVGHFLPALYFSVNPAGDAVSTDFTKAR